jgi:hypothetical protein
MRGFGIPNRSSTQGKIVVILLYALAWMAWRQMMSRKDYSNYIYCGTRFPTPNYPTSSGQSFLPQTTVRTHRRQPQTMSLLHIVSLSSRKVSLRILLTITEAGLATFSYSSNPERLDTRHRSTSHGPPNVYVAFLVRYASKCTPPSVQPGATSSLS